MEVFATLFVPEKLLQQQIFSTKSTRAAAASSIVMDTRPTTSMEQLISCVQRDLREVTKLKVRGWVLLQKLIRRRTLTPLSTAASRIISSIGDQYLLTQQWPCEGGPPPLEAVFHHVYLVTVVPR